MIFVLMSMLKMKLKIKKQKTEDDQGLLEAYNVPEYHCDKEKIKDLVDYIKTL